MERSLWSHRSDKVLEKEKAKLVEMSIVENKARKEGYELIGGMDEVGRGPLAGPVVTACVILPEKIDILGIDDSKKLTPEKREYLYDQIIDAAICYSIGIVNEKIIDEINILNATKLAMKKAVKAMKIKPELLLIDAVKFSYRGIKQMSIIKGDTLSVSIAAASIVAKVTRDRMMLKLDPKYPEYGFVRNKGYGTVEHIEAIRKHGLCDIHRRSFTGNFVPGEQLSIEELKIESGLDLGNAGDIENIDL